MFVARPGNRKSRILGHRRGFRPNQPLHVLSHQLPSTRSRYCPDRRTFSDELLWFAHSGCVADP